MPRNDVLQDLDAADAGLGGNCAFADIEVEGKMIRVAWGSVVAGSAQPTAERTAPVPLPDSLPTAVLRADMPIGPIILGAQTSVFYWEETDTIERFGDSGHYTFDLSALVRVRLAFGRYHRHEVVLSAPFGPSFDTFELGPRRFGGKLDNEVGWHAGGFAGYQFIRGGDLWGVFGEAGLVYHHIPKTIEYESTREELVFEPYHLFIRGGLILMPFR